MGHARFLLTVVMVAAALWPSLAKAADDDLEVRLLRAENTMLKSTLGDRKKDIAALKEKVRQLQDASRKQIAALKENVEQVQDALKKAIGEIATLRAENAELAAKAPPEPSAGDRQDAAVGAAPTQDAQRTESPVTLKVGDGELCVRFQFTTLYISANPPKTKGAGYRSSLFVTYRESGGAGHKKPVAGYFRVNGKPEKLTVRSSNEKVISVLAYEELSGLRFCAVGRGSANITVSLAGQSVSIPMKVVAIPVKGPQSGGFAAMKRGKVAHTKEDVIRILGLPDERVTRYLSWPESAFVDGIFYNADDPRWGVSIEHWKYKKFPNAVIHFAKDGTVAGVRTAHKLPWMAE